MAFYDNRLWLLSHIHNSFVSSDETGICEMVLSPETFTEDMTVIAKSHGLEAFLPDVLAGQEELDSFRSHTAGSPDIRAPPRQSVNNSVQAHQRTVRPDQDNVTTVQWRSPPAASDRTDDDGEEIFPKKIIPKPTHVTSQLSQELENMSIESVSNPWQEYGRFEGICNKDRKVDIFFVIDGVKVCSPLTIWCSREAKVKDVIGLACLKYFQQTPSERLEPPVHSYSLHMCEEDGSVDCDFPSLDLKEPFNKYGFSQLALVKKDQVDSCERITLYLPDGTFTELDVDKASISMGELLELGLQRRARILPRDRAGFSYHLETAEEAGTIDPQSPLSSYQSTQFFIVRDNSKRVSTHRDQASEKPVNFLDAPLFQSFDVQMISKVRTKVPIHLGISGEKVEIDPRQQPSWSVYKQKACTYDMDNIVSCEVVEDQGEGRKVFKMIYLTDSGWRWNEFEGDTDTVDAVIGKINHLIEMIQSEPRKLRKEYLENKEKKKSKRLSVK